MIYLIIGKLDNVTRRAWEDNCSSNELPTMEQLTEFLTQRCQILDTLNDNKEPKITISTKSDSNKINKINNFNRKSMPSNSCLTSGTLQCNFCKDSHLIFNCEKFLNLSIPERINSCKRLDLCVNCLKNRNHSIKSCFRGGCRTCGKKTHNTLLHYDNYNRAKDQSPSTKAEATSQKSSSSINLSAEKRLEQNQPPLATLTCSARRNTFRQIVLATAIVHILDNKGHPHPCRALLDSGAQSNFISERFAQRLKFPRRKVDSAVTGINSSYTQVQHLMSCQLSSRSSEFSSSLDFFILSKITQNLPLIKLPLEDIDIPTEIELADPSFFKPGAIDMLLGAQLFFELLLQEKVKLNDGLILQNTKLGWIVSGEFKWPSTNQFNSVVACHASESLDKQLERFWLMEECSLRPTLTEEEMRCENHYASTYLRGRDGRYTVQLPLKENVGLIGESKSLAMRRFESLERRFSKNPSLKQAYCEFIDEYVNLEHMELVPPNEANLKPEFEFYLPHHAVVKESSTTTKLRVVFDASAKSSTGVSLNDILMVGPTIQSDLWSMVLRFRRHKIVMTADLAKMYRQIKVAPPYIDLQRILWRRDPQDEIKIYRLLTITYGTSSAPFQATRTIFQLAEDESTNFPKASHVAREDFYMDDLMTGAECLEEAVELHHQLYEMFKKGGFELRKWCSNDQQFLANIHNDHEITQFEIDANQRIKTLGLYWNPKDDYFYYNVNLEGQQFSIITKRSILSDLAHVFDPLGLIGPVIAKAKIFMQQLWLLKLDWDTELPKELASKWQEFREGLTTLGSIRIPRRAMYHHYNISIHGYSDASEKCYGACVYLRTADAVGNVTVTLLTSKSRVAPIKQLTLPRLELCGALVLARLVNKTVTTLQLTISQVYLWSDSTVVLSWLKAPASQWKTFVSHRVQEIQDLTSNYNWNHVLSADNPADCLSRGLSIGQLINSSLWWQGPSWLTKSSAEWPIQSLPNEIEPPERKCSKSNFTSTIDDSMINKYSTLRKLIRVTTYMKRFIHNCKNPNTKFMGVLSVAELNLSFNYWLQQAQTKGYPQEVQDLKKKGHVSPNSKLCALKPIWDKELNLIRVGGRLQNSLLTPDQKNPIILPPKYKLTDLIIAQEHLRLHHAGPQALLCHLREMYWLVNGRNTIRKILHSCIKCFRAKPKINDQIMGQLPSCRVRPSRPFTHTGVDYCGPIYARPARRRGLVCSKTYIALFVCMSTKAMHLELVEDLTTSQFLAALRRFVARRGKPSHMYSDNGTNFVGANRELKELRDLWQSETHRKGIQVATSDQGIQWSFIPANSPHFGGLWESGVRLVKYHLRRAIGNSQLSFLELITLLAEIEACLNSRPITPTSSNPSDFSCLTPSHFLIGDNLQNIPQPDLQNVPINHLTRWQYQQLLLQHFWSRWTLEYLGELQSRTKWKTSREDITLDTMVLIKEDNTTPLHWRLGRVIGVHRGPDGRVRVVNLRTQQGTLQRAIHKVCSLPLEKNHGEDDEQPDDTTNFNS